MGTKTVIDLDLDGSGVRRHRFTVANFHHMAEIGIFPPDAGVELIDGGLIETPSDGGQHARVVDDLARHLTEVASSRARVWCQRALTLGPWTQLKPDICLLRPRADDYALCHPHAEDVLLAIEVADQTLKLDRAIRLPRYADSGIPEVWIIDVSGTALLMHYVPVGDGYGMVLRLDAPGAVRPVTLPEIRIDLSGLFTLSS